MGRPMVLVSVVCVFCYSLLIHYVTHQYDRHSRAIPAIPGYPGGCRFDFLGCLISGYPGLSRAIPAGCPLDFLGSLISGLSRLSRAIPSIPAGCPFDFLGSLISGLSRAIPSIPAGCPFDFRGELECPFLPGGRPRRTNGAFSVLLFCKGWQA